MTNNGTETQMKTRQPDIAAAASETEPTAVASETEPPAPAADDRSDAGDVDAPESVKGTESTRKAMANSTDDPIGGAATGRPTPTAPTSVSASGSSSSPC